MKRTEYERIKEIDLQISLLSKRRKALDDIFPYSSSIGEHVDSVKITTFLKKWDIESCQTVAGTAIEGTELSYLDAKTLAEAVSNAFGPQIDKITEEIRTLNAEKKAMFED